MYHVCVPTARLCAVWVENNTRHVCEQSIPAGLKCPSLIYDHLINHPAWGHLNREQPRSTRILVTYSRPAFSATKRTNHAPISFDQQAQVFQDHVSYRKKKENWITTEAHDGGGLELVKPAREPASSRPKPCVYPWKSPTNLARSPLLVSFRRKKTNRGQRSAFPSETSRFAPLFSRTGVQHSPGSLTIELPSAFAESGAYSPDRALLGSPWQCSLPLACRRTSRSAPNWSSEEARTWKHHPQPTIPRGAYSPDRALLGSPWQCSLPLACRRTSRSAPNWSSEEARTWKHHPQPTIPPPRLRRSAEPRRQPVGCTPRGWARPYTRRKDTSLLISFPTFRQKQGQTISYYYY